MPDRIKDIAYAIVGRVFHLPWLLRLIAALFRRFPALNRFMPSPVMASRATLNAAMARTADFSHAAHLPNLPAGKFVIGFDEGPHMRADRAMLIDWIRRASPPGSAAAAESRSRLGTWRQEGRTTIDLIDDYLIWVVWSELRQTLGAQASALTTATPGDDYALLMELRFIGAHLVVGSVAPERVRRRAEDKASALNARVERAWPDLADLADLAGQADQAAIRRNAVGMMWVGHPATVQAGALVIQELFGRPDVHRGLSDRAQALGAGAWSDAAFRFEIKQHIIELLRFRPVFPLLPRLVLRDVWCDIGGGESRQVKSGAGVVLALIGAMFDPDAQWAPGTYRPTRYIDRWARHGEDEYLMFGLGDRHCVARYLVIDILISAVIGLLQMPGLHWARRSLFQSRITYDGVIITHLPVAFDPLG